MKRKRLARDSGALLVSLVVAVVLVAVPATRATAVAPDPENCSVTNSVTPGITAASADVQTTGVAQRGVTDPRQVVLSQVAVTFPIPVALLQSAVDNGILHDGDTLSAGLSAVIFGDNTSASQKTLQTTTDTVVTLHVVSGVLQPLTPSLALPNSNWRLQGTTLAAAFSERGATLTGQIQTQASGTFGFEFACTPVVIPTAVFAISPLLVIAPASVAMGPQRVGTFGNPQTFTVTNHGGAAESVLALGVAGTNPFDFFGDSTCISNNHSVVLAPGAGCRVRAFFAPTNVGRRSAQIIVHTSIGEYAVAISGTGTEGFFLAGANGEVANFGDAVFHGDAAGLHLSAPMISMATTPNGAGYWLLGRDGGIFSYGNAHFYGSTGGIKLNKPVVAMSTSRGGKGYRLVASDGGIFAFGDAGFYGSTGGIALNQPIVGMASTVSGHGYWLVASDGGIFAFGDAHFLGSTAGSGAASPIIQITPTPTGKGYWLLAAQGQLYAFGDARNYGTATGQAMAGMSVTPDGRGYWEATRTGRVLNFGDAHSYGDIADLGVNDVIAIAGTSPPLPVGLLKPAAQAAPAVRAQSFGFAAIRAWAPRAGS